ncbi:dihydropteroate synthase [Synechococcus sp. CCY9202]|nr:dihydropteroate synthase [Synechococcus sp. CCY9202]
MLAPEPPSFALMSTPHPRTLLGVINLSPESMVRDSVVAGTEQLLQRAAWLHSQGCAVIDLGARSITPTAAMINDAEEQRRLLPALGRLLQEGYRVSVDTWSSQTVRVALEAGATAINFTGADIEPSALAAVAAAGASLMLTYMPYGDAYRMRTAAPVPYRLQGLLDHLGPRVEQARAAGVGEVIIDPNLGIIHPATDDVGKIQLQNSVLWNLDVLRQLGCPILLYAARKPERLARILFASNVLFAGADWIRTHHPDMIQAMLTAATP